jgi:hypothetical protein
MRRRHFSRKMWAWGKDVSPRVDSGWEGDGVREKTWVRNKMFSSEKHVSLGWRRRWGRGKDVA